MILSEVEITDFLSVRGTVRLLLDKNVTVLLGSNDHGKSNILKAIERLNEDSPITEDDVNWDASSVPSIQFTLALTQPEREAWQQAINQMRTDVADADNQPEGDSEPKPTEEPEEPKAAREAAAKREAQRVLYIKEARAFLSAAPLHDAPHTVVLRRVGVQADLELFGIAYPDLPLPIHGLLTDSIPRVELFKSLTGNLQDSVNSASLTTEEYEFMQGLFYYADLDPQQAKTLFAHTDRTERQLQNASKVLAARG